MARPRMTLGIAMVAIAYLAISYGGVVSLVHRTSRYDCFLGFWALSFGFFTTSGLIRSRGSNPAVWGVALAQLATFVALMIVIQIFKIKIHVENKFDVIKMDAIMGIQGMLVHVAGVLGGRLAVRVARLRRSDDSRPV